MDGKTMKNAIDKAGNQTHIMSVIGHDSNVCYTQKKVGTLPVVGSDEQKRTNEIGMAIPLLEGCEVAGKVVTGDALLTQARTGALSDQAPGPLSLYRQRQPAHSGT